MSSTAEVIKKKGRPKKSTTENITTIAVPVAVKVKKPRLSRKPTSSPNGRDQDVPLAESTQPSEEQDEKQPASSPKAVKEPKPRPLKSVAAETVVAASKQVQAPSTRPEPSLILPRAKAFVEAKREEPRANPPESSVRLDAQVVPKEFKPAGTLPSFVGSKTTTTPSSPPRNTFPPAAAAPKSPFLADFFTEPPLVEQPAWSRPKRPATISTGGSNPSSEPPTAAVIETPIRDKQQQQQPDTATVSSAATIPLESKQVVQNPSENNALHEAAPALELDSAKIPQEQPPLPLAFSSSSPAILKEITPPTSATSTSTIMSSTPPPQSSKPTHLPKSIPSPVIPRLPPRASPTPTAPPKPSSLPLSELKRDPRFRTLSRRWTSLMVGVPILLVTTYALYGRYTETAVQRRPGERGGGGVKGEERGSGSVDRRTINGGV